MNPNEIELKLRLQETTFAVIEGYRPEAHMVPKPQVHWVALGQDEANGYVGGID